MKFIMKNKEETLLFDRFHIYDALIAVGIALIVLSLIFFASMFTGTLSMGRATVIIGILLMTVGGIVTANGRVMKKKALGEVDDFYEDYTKKSSVKDNENSDEEK